MDLIYLDYNCFQRGFDDPRQIRIQMEALACQEIFIRLCPAGDELMEEAKVMNDTEIRITGIEVLNKTLGPVATLRFLTLFHREPTDYVEISRRLYEGQTVDEIFERARGHWQE